MAQDNRSQWDGLVLCVNCGCYIGASTTQRYTIIDGAVWCKDCADRREALAKRRSQPLFEVISDSRDR